MNIFGIGTVVVDHVLKLPHFPAEDTKVEIGDQWTQVGGPVPVALSTAAFFGAPTAFLGRWGQDAAGDLISTTLCDRGIKLSACDSAASWSSGFAHVWIDASTGSRTIAYSRGTFPPPNEQDVTEAMLSDTRILHLDGWAADAAIKAAAIVKRNGGTVVLDAGSVKPRIDELLPLVDVLIASKLFQTSRFGEFNVPAADLLSLGPANVITTDGARGATWLTKDAEIHELAIPVTAVDTNGAGDIFSGCILNALRLQQSPREALQFANKVAGYACTQPGNHSLPAITES
jgi:sugar/nucleoside kinase (ribokinase family)